MRLMTFPHRIWPRFWLAVCYWHYLNYSWNLAWHKARRDS